ncbi:MAG TPA: AGE family epimerase/isomerase [Bauldia sp.]|nr:AGE family epimerase/isomerase [Bauldia sp.]
MTFGKAATGARWATLPYHRRWLIAQATALLDFFEAESIDPRGGFFTLNEDGRPISEATVREIHVTTRTVHCFAIARLMGRPGADRFIDHGMEFLWKGHRDSTHGGYVWSVGEAGDDRKQAYGHAFVLLAASSAKVVGHPAADRLLADVTEVLERRFWEPGQGASAEEFARDWSPVSRYRGQNSNMHLTEATMAAYEATGDRMYLEWAESIATLIISKNAAAVGWQVPEHYDADWKVDRNYAGGDVFRPYGITPGHALEWTRLILQLWELGGRRLAWLPNAATELFRRATQSGWDKDNGGFHYTLDWDGRPHLRNRLWWPAAEGIGAAAFLNQIDGAPEYEEWYRRIWDFIAGQIIDREHGGWRTEAVDPTGKVAPLFSGKPDLYHALQACLIPLLPTNGSITRGLAPGGLVAI